MMSSKAWDDLMIDVQAMMDATDTLSGATPENLHFKQGELSIMRWLVNLAAVSERTYDQLKEENEGTS